jgi:hypothetical protein
MDYPKTFLVPAGYVEWLTYIPRWLKNGTALEAKLSSQILISVTWSFKSFHKKSIVHFILLKWYSQSLNGV